MIQETGNLVTNVRGTSGHDVWLGTGGNSQLNGQHPTNLWGCCTSYSGSAPFFDTSQTNGNGQSGQIIWSFGNATVNYIVNTGNALAGLGSTGLQVHGYKWGYDIRNMNGVGGQGGVDTLTATSRLWNSTYTGGGLASQSIVHNTTMDWTRFNSTVTLPTPQNISNVGNLQLSFSSRDSGFWAGYYGPQIRDVRASLLYSVDPCVSNPLYASHCPGFNNIVTSGNLVPNPNGYASWGQSLNQTFNIATALQHGGLGVRVHGFQWGFDAWVGNPYCASWFLWCSDNRDPDLSVNVNIRDSSGNSIYSSNRKGEFDDKPYWQTYNYSYVLPSTRNSLTLGNFEFTGQTTDQAAIANMYARIQYTPDQCVLNPLFSTSCTGYAEAYFNQQCSLNPLYNSQCPGYQEAYYSQQCSLNALYDTGCPGYAAAYFTQQCTINGLYDKACPNYQSAFLAFQCEKNQLYSTQCPGYTQAKLLKDLQDQQAAQTATATESTSTTTTATPTATASTSATSTTNAATADPTRTETVVTTDVGGVELTTTGQISVPTGQPAASRESSTTAARTEETRAEPTRERETERRRVDPRALSIAMAAVAATERTALATAEQAVVMSQASVGPNDGTGIAIGSGLSLQTNRSQSLADDRSDERRDEGRSTQTQRSSGPTDNINLLATPPQPAPESNQKAGPSVRRGGAVEGMEGGPDPAALARAPLDFNQYLNSQLKDAQFYQSREIYRGQRTVDNARAQRFLNGASDVLHQRMVDQQYRIGQ